MAKDQGANLQATRSIPRTARPSTPKSGSGAQPPAAVVAKKRTSVAQFIREVRVEARKTSWTPWRETWIISVMVFVMVAVTAVFFLLVDSVLSFLIQQILKLAS